MPSAHVPRTKRRSGMSIWSGVSTESFQFEMGRFVMNGRRFGSGGTASRHRAVPPLVPLACYMYFAENDVTYCALRTDAGGGMMLSGKDLPMIQQTTRTGQASAKGLSPQEALVSLLIASARADGSVSAHEANSIEHVVAGMKLFRGHSHEGVQKVFATAAERITEQGISSVVQTAAAIVPKELGVTTFAIAVDLMLSDGGLSPKEEAFVEELRTLLNVERDTAGRIIDVLLVKNAG